MINKRNFYSDSSCDVINYNLYETIASKLGDYLNNKNISPNQVSIFRGIVFLLISILLFCTFQYKFNKIIMIGIILTLLVFQWILDDVDGYIARKFNKKSKIGASLDYWIDTVCTYLFIGIMTYIIYKNNKKIAIEFVMSIGFLTLLHYRIVKKYMRNDTECEPTLLHILTNIHALIFISIIIIFIKY